MAQEFDDRARAKLKHLNHVSVRLTRSFSLKISVHLRGCSSPLSVGQAAADRSFTIK